MRIKSISTRLFILISLLIMASQITLSFALSVKFRNDYIENKTNFMQENLYKSKQSIDFFLRAIENTSNSLANNNNIKNTFSQLQISIESKQLLDDLINFQDSISDIYLVNLNNDIVNSNQLHNEEVKKEIYDIINFEAIKERSGFYFIKNLDSFFYARAVLDNNNKEYLGVIVFDISKNYLRELLLQLYSTSNDKVILLDSNSSILINQPIFTDFDPFIKEYTILTNTSNALLKEKVFGIDSIIISSTVGRDWKIISISSLQEMNDELHYIQLVSATILGIFIFISIIFALLLSSRFTKPIVDLNSKIIKQMSKNDNYSNEQLQLNLKKGDEFKQLNNSFDKMIETQQNLFNEVLLEQKRKSELKFELLQAQINPHFLYNTLDTIKWMALIGNTENIEEFVNALINLLRYNISNSNLTTLHDEIKSIYNYVILQKYKYGNTFSINYNIAENTKNCTVLHLILQPLVENAIFHAFSSNDIESEVGIISIYSIIKNETLYIEVTDNGIGIAKADLEKILGKKTKGKKFSSIGLTNLNERIKLYYGDNYGLKISSKKNCGCKVTLKLPVRYWLK